MPGKRFGVAHTMYLHTTHNTDADAYALSAYRSASQPESNSDRDGEKWRIGRAERFNPKNNHLKFMQILFSHFTCVISSY